jgi:uncharacterized FlaG/YvyC family protein
VKRGWKSHRGSKWADVHTSLSKYRVRSNTTPFQNRQSSNIQRKKSKIELTSKEINSKLNPGI